MLFILIEPWVGDMKSRLRYSKRIHPHENIRKTKLPVSLRDEECQQKLIRRENVQPIIVVEKFHYFQAGNNLSFYGRKFS